MGKAKTESSRRPVGRARLESIAASITPEEMAKARKVYEAKGWTRPDGGVGVRAGWHFAMVPTAIIKDTNVGRDALLVAVALCSFVNDRGVAWPSWATLEATARLHRRHVRAGLDALEKLGYLVRQRGGGRKSTAYVIHTARRGRRRTV